METGAFCGCKRLRRVSFGTGSQLTWVGRKCFFMSGLVDIQLPSGLRNLSPLAFALCKNLKQADLNEGLRNIED